MATTVYYLVKTYVGPVHLAHYAAQAHAAGLMNVWTGTAHVYGTIASAPLVDVTDRLCLQQRVTDLVYGSPMAAGHRDTEIVRQA